MNQLRYDFGPEGASDPAGRRAHLLAPWSDDTAGITRMGEILERAWLRPEHAFATLAAINGLPFVDLRACPCDATLLAEADAEFCIAHNVLPWRRISDRLRVVTAWPAERTLAAVRERWGDEADLAVCDRTALHEAAQARFAPRLTELAVNELARLDPELSAARVLTGRQAAVFSGFALLISLAIMAKSQVLWIIGSILLTAFYTGSSLFKFAAVWASSASQELKEPATGSILAGRDLETLPLYSILVPMFREPQVLPILVDALKNLDYPQTLLDIKLVLEEGDEETISAAREMNLGPSFEIITVPPSFPRTKPKACNYALRFVRGEFVVIYDAEDRPEPDQLLKVLDVFMASTAQTACVQCRLNFYNREENWLTRLFTLDYALWFDLLLPGLERMQMPIPLGGTSNHFRTSVLRSIHGWDPFNVTEDADLGLRLVQQGYVVRLADSTTFEEANVSIPNWIRQRSRWMKGYMQTLLVHTRHPVQFARRAGPLGLLGFVLFIGGTVLSGLLSPLLWAVFALWVTGLAPGILSGEVEILGLLSLFNLLVGNGVLTFLLMLSPMRRGWSRLVSWSLTGAIYWALMSIAAWKAAIQLVHKPFYWEKTHHGLSRHVLALGVGPGV